jgi:hypothetical protein
MDEAHNRFRAALIEDMRHVYEKGLDPKAKAGSMPALAELAEALHPPNDGNVDYGRAVKEVLRDAIDRVGDDPINGATADERRTGLMVLFDVGKYPGGDLTWRRDDSADSLGFKNGNSFRKAERDDRKVEDLFIEEVVGLLLTLAGKHHFIYSAVRSWGTFYPDRPVYDYNSLSWNYGRYGATDGRPVFNSFINTPSYGDERAFFDGRRGNQSNMENWDPVTNVTSDRTAVLRMYVDNMAYVFPEDPYLSTAYGARVRVHLPTATATVLRARGYIWADNADMVEDTVDLIGSEPFRVVYIPGSAVLRRHTYEYGLDDSIIEEEGAPIGHTVMDGILPAGSQFEYTALVKVTVRILTHHTHE